MEITHLHTIQIRPDVDRQDLRFHIETLLAQVKGTAHMLMFAHDEMAIDEMAKAAWGQYDQIVMLKGLVCAEWDYGKAKVSKIKETA